jgi:hypothetical protein
MTRSLTSVLNVFRHLPRAAAIMLVLWSPLLAIKSVRADTGAATIEAPTPKKNGMGFVLLVSLRRG